MYQDSKSENVDHWYFFAVTGLNISQKIITTLMDTTKFDDAILPHFDLFIGDEIAEFDTSTRDKSTPFKNQLV